MLLAWAKWSNQYFDVYMQIFNHIEDASLYLQSQVWQEKMEQVNNTYPNIIMLNTKSVYNWLEVCQTLQQMLW